MDIGLDCYISGHIGFCGQLKKFCEDFKVTEIDERGHEVKITNQAVDLALVKDVDMQCRNVANPHKDVTLIPVVTGESCSHEKLTNSDKKSSPCSTSKLFYQLADITSPVAIQKAFDKLTDLIGESKMTKLQEVSCSVQIDTDCLHLGYFDNKNDRAIIHLNTRMVYPTIKTETVQQDEKYAITAHIDHLFLEFLSLFNDRASVEGLMRFCCCIDKDIPVSYDLPHCEEKDTRTKIHRLLAKHFGSFLESKTFTAERKDNNKKSCIQIRMRQKKGSRKVNDQQLNEKQPFKNKRSLEKDSNTVYTGFVLKKENMETLQAIECLSRSLGVHPSVFSFAGIKDKKAITLQNVVVKGVTPQELSVVNSNPTLSNITIGNYRVVHKPMEKGQHKGNAFSIIIRDIYLKSQTISDTSRYQDALNKDINDAVDNIKTYGFVNYFGEQRFGQGDGNTRADEIGLAMIQGDMVKAVQLLLKPSSKKDDTNDAKRYYQETGDIPGTLSRMPRDRTRECLILKSLHRHGNDKDGCRKAFFNIPYSMRLLYAHSYVSLLWNKMASYRLKEYGVTSVVVGDLVHDCHVSDNYHLQSAPNETTQSAVNEMKQSSGNETAIPAAKHCSQDSTKTHCTSTASLEIAGTKVDENKKANELDHVTSEERDIKTSIDKEEIKVVSEEDVSIGKYNIRDVVLPIPGYNVVYPTNSVKKRYHEALEKDGLESKSFRLRSLGMTLPGAYRKVIAVPKDVQWKWLVNFTTSFDISKESENFSLENSFPRETNYSQTMHSSSDKCIENPEKTNTCMNKDDKERERNEANVTDSGDSLEQCHKPCEKRLKLDPDSSFIDTFKCVSRNLEISFKLQPSCYATVCLREMMKT